MALTVETFGQSRKGYKKIRCLPRQLGTAEKPVISRVVVDVQGEGPRAPKPGEVVEVSTEDAFYLVSHGKAEFFKPEPRSSKAG